MNEKEGFDFQEESTEEGFPHEEVREVSLVFSEEEEADTWPPKTMHTDPPATGDLSVDRPEVVVVRPLKEGLFRYEVKCLTGITINGKLFAAGEHDVEKEIYETLSTLDAPYQD